ncbi:MAG: ATP-dependent RNA helicase HrpA [Gammaproteobacteria bacterium]|nr:ATP-dependent RNA helicase HrpA [Gammaproteobacteria bacterium]
MSVPDTSALAGRLEAAMLRDRPRLRRRLRRLRREPDAVRATQLADDIESSCARADARRARLPGPTFPAGLPISARLDDVAAALASHQVVVVAGATGSGKTTQLPKLCLRLGRGVHGQIGHTQPRRLAARSVAARIAAELDTPLGDLVGYRVRFQERGHPDALVRVMTDGILLNELQRDRLLLRYDTLIVDEAHERSLNIDFLLGYLKKLLPKRPELRVIVTSATIDTARFAAHFGDAPVVTVDGRSWPVETRYRPLAGGDEERDSERPAAILAAIDELAAEDPDGDVLVFLPGERAIRETAEALRKHHPPGVEILPLYARLGAAEQARIFAPGPARRIVLATNVAETSLTVPGIRHVVDTGLARISRYGPHGNIQHLPVEPVSRASADQRRGRCGRLAPGICIRLYGEEEYLERPEFTEPEILRTPLAAVILQMVAHGLGHIERFPFLEPPDPRRVRDGYRQLADLGALDRDHRLTPLGHRLARLPLDPRLGRMLLAAHEAGALREVLVIVAALAVQDPRARPHDAAAAADRAHAGFADPRSDLLGHLRLWEAWQEQRRHLSQNRLRTWCRDRFLGFMRMREWQETHLQLDRLVRDMGLHPDDAPAEPEVIHRALLAGLLDQVARRETKRAYRGLRDRTLQLFPGSVLAEHPPAWIAAAELVETRRLYARGAMPVRPRWIETLAGDQVRREFLEPRWDRRRGQVVARERVTFHGLVLVARRRVNFGPVEPESAREIFIRAALLDGRLDTRGRFLRHNLDLVAGIETLEARTRRRDLLVDEESRYRFYDERLPASVYDRGTFEAWRRRVERERPCLLFMTRDLLLRDRVDADVAERYPTALPAGRIELPLAYRFAPDAADDGITADVPLAALEQLTQEHLAWLVPGLLGEKVAALLRALPKALRRQLVPLPETVAACLDTLRPGEGPLGEQLARALRTLRGVDLPAGTWDALPLPPHLVLHLRLVDADGSELARGDDLAELQRRFGDRARASRAAALPAVLGSGEEMTDWSCDALPERVMLDQGGIAVEAWPGLAERGAGVAVELFGTRDAARRSHRRALRRLCRLRLGTTSRDLWRALPDAGRLALQFATVGDVTALRDDLLDACIDRLCVDDAVRDAEAFAARLDAARPRVKPLAEELAERVDTILAAHRAVAVPLASLDPRDATARDLRGQLEDLVYPGFVAATPAERLADLPRYLEAARRRLEKAPLEPGRERQRAAELAPWVARWREMRGERPDDPELETYRWLLEEFRVSLYAQELGTAQPVSAKRLARQWERVRAGRPGSQPTSA